MLTSTNTGEYNVTKKYLFIGLISSPWADDISPQSCLDRHFSTDVILPNKLVGGDSGWGLALVGTKTGKEI